MGSGERPAGPVERESDSQRLGASVGAFRPPIHPLLFKPDGGSGQTTHPPNPTLSWGVPDLTRKPTTRKLQSQLRPTTSVGQRPLTNSKDDNFGQPQITGKFPHNPGSISEGILQGEAHDNSGWAETSENFGGDLTIPPPDNSLGATPLSGPREVRHSDIQAKNHMFRSSRATPCVCVPHEKGGQSNLSRQEPAEEKGSTLRESVATLRPTPCSMGAWLGLLLTPLPTPSPARSRDDKSDAPNRGV